MGCALWRPGYECTLPVVDVRHASSREWERRVHVDVICERAACCSYYAQVRVRG